MKFVSKIQNYEFKSQKFKLKIPKFSFEFNIFLMPRAPSNSKFE